MAKSPDAAKRGYERSAAKKAAYTKVSQGTIDKIKGMGMTAALKRAGTSSNAEFVEGVKRMYGARRVSAAKGAASDKRIPKPSTRVDKSTRQPKNKKGGGGSFARMR